jgi:hypothetical protein
MDEQTIKTKKLSMYMRSDIHSQIKAAAALRNISMSLLVHRAVYNYLKEEDRVTLQPESIHHSRQ